MSVFFQCLSPVHPFLHRLLHLLRGHGPEAFRVTSKQVHKVRHEIFLSQYDRSRPTWSQLQVSEDHELLACFLNQSPATCRVATFSRFHTLMFAIAMIKAASADSS